MDHVTLASWRAHCDLHPRIRPVVAVQGIDAAIVPVVLVRYVACSERARSECGHWVRCGARPRRTARPRRILRNARTTPRSSDGTRLSQGANYKLEGRETADTRSLNVNRETPNSVSAGMLMHENIKSSPCVLNSLKCSSKTLVVKLA